MAHQKDLTKGPVFLTMFLFALPMIFGNLLQQGYNIVDTWVVGKFIGPDALAAVGTSYALMTFLTSILLGLCMGSGVVFSLCFGQQDEERLKNSVCTSFLLAALITVLLTLFSLWNVRFIIAWLNIPEEIIGITQDYLIIIFWGIPAVFLYNFFGAYLKALGNSVMPLVFLGIAAVLNIGLDLLFVAGFGWGTAGAAGATVISQYISGFGIGTYAFAKNQVIRTAFRHWNVKKARFGEIAGYSLLTCMQQSVMNLGILMVQGLVNSFGTVIMAAFAAAVKIDSFAYMQVQEFANGFSTFIAQNMGAKKQDRIMKGIRAAVYTAVSYCVVVSRLLWIFAKQLMLIFISPEETAILSEGIRYLHIEGTFYWGIGCLFLFYGLYRALGKPMMSVVLTVVSLGTRVALAYMLSAIPAIGVAGIWWSVPIGWILADLVGLFYFILKKDTLLRNCES